MRKTKRVLATGFPIPDSLNSEELRKTFIVLQKREEERARRAERERSGAKPAPAPVRKPAGKVKRAADTAA